MARRSFIFSLVSSGAMGARTNTISAANRSSHGTCLPIGTCALIQLKCSPSRSAVIGSGVNRSAIVYWSTSRTTCGRPAFQTVGDRFSGWRRVTTLKFDPGYATALLFAIYAAPRFAFTAREEHVLRLAFEDATDLSIARILRISEPAVKKYFRTIYEKEELRPYAVREDRVTAAAKA